LFSAPAKGTRFEVISAMKRLVIRQLRAQTTEIGRKLWAQLRAKPFAKFNFAASTRAGHTLRISLHAERLVELDG
jgi:very-short-patch-repair endonuclease